MFRVSRRLPWVLVACVGIVVAGCGGAKSRYLHHLARGEQYLGAGQFDKASVEFRNALQIEPRSAQALYLNGQAAERRGNLRVALGSYQGAIDANPDYTAARAALARMLVFGGGAGRALTVIAPGLARHPDDPQLLAVRGAAHAQLKDVNAAVADAEHALKADPDNEDAAALLASLYQRQGETARAIELVESVVARRPDSVDLRQVLASLYLSMHDNARCEAQLQKIIGLAPRELPHRYQLALFYLQTGNKDAAQRVLEEAVRSFPDSNAAKLALVDFITQQRSRAQGEEILRAYIAREPNNDDLRMGLGALLQRGGASVGAILSYGEIVSRDPTSAASLTARDRIAAIELEDGRVDDAHKLIAAVLEQNPRDDDALLMRARIALGRGDPATAIADLRAVLRDRPDALIAKRALARAYLANGDTPLAEETLRAASDAAPADTPVRLDLSQLLLETGRADAAAALLEETVRRAPADAAARAALVRVYLTKHDLPDARTAAQDLVTLQPASATGPYLVGLVAQQQNRLDDGQLEFEQALKLAPDDLEALAALARLQLARGQESAAVARVRAFALAHARDPYAQNLLGELLVATRAYPAAIERLTQAVGLAPAWPLPYHNLALARLGANDPAGAVAAYQAGLRQAPYDPLLVSGLAALFERQGRIGEAIAQYEDLCAHRPRLQLAANNLAMLLVTYRTDRRSLDRARALTAAFAASDNGALLDTNGWVRLKLGDLTDALSVLERAADRAPDSKLIRYHLAMAELRAGRRDRARADLKTALSGTARFAGSDDARAALNSLNAGGRG